MGGRICPNVALPQTLPPRIVYLAGRRLIKREIRLDLSFYGSYAYFCISLTIFTESSNSMEGAWN